MKKLSLVTLVLITSMLMGLFQGCAAEAPGETVQDSPTESSQQVVSETPAQNEANDVSISYPISDGSLKISLAIGVPQFILAAVENQEVKNIAAYKQAAEVCGIDLDVTCFDMEAASTQVNLMIASGDFTDIVNSLTDYYTSGAVGAIEDGICVDLLEYAEQYASDYYRYYMENEDYRKDVTDDNGRVASMFGAQEAGYNITGLMLRGDYLTELNLEAPTTYDELEQVLSSMKTAYDVQMPAFFSGAVQLGSLINGYGIDSATYSVDKDGKVVYNAVTNEYKAYITMLNKWYESGLINLDMLIDGNVSPGESIAYIADGRTVLLTGESDFMSASNRAISEDENYDIIPISDPTLEKNGTLRVGGDNGKASTSVGWSVNADSKDIKEAIMFMNWFWTDEGQLASNFGIENVGFAYDEDGNPQYTDLILNNKEFGFAAAWRGNTSFQVPSVAWYSAVEATFTHESQKACAGVWSKGRSIEGTYFGTLTTLENETVSQSATDMSTLSEERIARYITGELNLESDWDQYVADMESLGLSKCVGIYQTAYERYLSR